MSTKGGSELKRLLALLGWGPVDDVAEDLTREFIRLVPLAKVGNEPVVTKAVGIVVGHAKGHRRKRDWGFMASNRCSNAVKWRLLDLGYPADLAETLARALAVGMSQDR
jgi:hypothetical protein